MAMKPFFIFDFFQNAGKKAALGIGSLLLILGLLVLFFPELLRTMIGLMLVSAAVPLLIYGLKDDFRFRRPPTKPDDEIRIIYPE
jgi:multisubunit Na+/H+ antiporter MnhC subunit